ncbi:hypothetical protein ACVBGC_11955 [Burkholderia stagnalis]
MNSDGSMFATTTIGKTVVVDASQYGPVTNGTLHFLSTVAGLGVNTQERLSATVDNVVVNSSNNIAAGQVFPNQGTALASSGNTTISNTGLANCNDTAGADGDANASEFDV